MKMTQDDLKKLQTIRPGIFVTDKCDHCGKPITGLLSYRGHSPETLYCSRVCLEQAKFISKGNKQMAIEKKAKKAVPEASLNKAVDGSPKNKAEVPKKVKTPKNKAETSENKAEVPKKVKTPKNDTEVPKNKAETSENKAEVPKKVKTPKNDTEVPKKSSVTPYREGSNFARAFQTLQNAGKAITVEEMFAGLEAADPNRMLTHMIRRGEESGEFQIVRADGKIQLLKAYEGRTS